jgi:cyclopropane fatty-acyl-phospholipid synthase-like methyltransferase
MSRFSRPLPEKVSVSSFALAQIINALNGAPHHIRELQAARGCALVSNPIDIIERELMEAQSTTDFAEASAAAHAEASVEGTLHNYRRQGGLSVKTVLELADHYLVTSDKERAKFKAHIETIAGEQA